MANPPRVAPEPGVAPKPTGDPTVAVLLTWFVPGAGHLYLGRVRFAVVAFVVLQGLYLAGLALTNGMFLEILPPEMRGRFSAALTPEAGNLGMLLHHVMTYGYGAGHPRPWPDGMDLGILCTTASGIGNVLLMSRAHLDARLPEREHARALDPSAAALASWLVPGLGQWLQGRRGRALASFALLVSLFAVGTLLAQGVNLDRERHFYYWSGQVLLGLPAIAAELVNGHPRMESDVAYAEGGVVLGCVAGMLNVLVMMDAYAWSEARHLGVSEKASRAAQGAPRSKTAPSPAVEEAEAS